MTFAGRWMEMRQKYIWLGLLGLPKWMHERPSMDVTLCHCLSSLAFCWVAVVWLPPLRPYDLVGQLCLLTLGKVWAYLILYWSLANPNCKFGVFIFPAGALAGKARSKVFEMNRTEPDQMLALYSFLFFFFMLFSILRCTKLISLM